MKKRLTTIVGLLLMLTAPTLAQEFESATEAVKNMGVGWNLGNTLDANGAGVSDVVKSETYWGQPVTRPKLITMMRDAGFGAIRVPVTWYAHIDADGNIDAAWLKRVHEVVDYVIDAGLYCILNVHHDTGAHDQAWVIADADNYGKTKARFENLWTQIATEFKDYDQHLLFEAYNEMLDKYQSWCFATFNTSSKYIADDAASAYKGLNGYAQSFVNVVRATGGNNAQRNLVICTYAAANGGGSWNSHLTDVLTELVTPTDIAEGHLAYEVHAYPTLANGKSEVSDIIKKVTTYLQPKGPVILGEWGTSNVDANETDYAKNPEKYLEFCQYLVEQTKANNIAPFYWMGLSDGIYRSYPVFNQPDIAETIVKAYHGANFKGTFPTADQLEMIYVIKYNDTWSELFLSGDWGDSKSIKLSDYKGITVEMVDDSYVDKLQVKLYGKQSGQEAYIPLTGTVSTVMFEDYQSAIGDVIPRITLQTMIGSQVAKLKKATLIKSDGSEVSGDITVAWGCSLEAEQMASAIHAVQTSSASSNAAIYNLAGQRVTSPKKGIYIRNGKKFVMK